MRVRFFSLLAGLSLCGCAALQDYHYNWTQCYRADAAWRDSFGVWNTQFSRDYQEGWKAGHADISQGNCHEPPPVPPKKYWAAAYQSESGRCCIDEWYNGWRDGAAASLACGNGDWHNIVAAPTVPPGANSSTGFSHATNTANPGPAEIPAMARKEKVKVAPANYVQPPVHVAPLPEYGETDLQTRVTIGGTGPIGSAISENYAVPVENETPAAVSFTLGDDPPSTGGNAGN